MERVSQVQLTSVLKETAQPSPRRLPDEELIQLALLARQTYERYPSQDMADTMEGYLWDLEQLALDYSLSKVMDALSRLRRKPGQTFLPRPDEVASEIERQQEEQRRVCEMKAQDERRAREIAEFWAWAPEWMQITGNSEEELLRRFPSYRGTKTI